MNKAAIWRTELYVLYLAVRDGKTPLLPKLVSAIVAAYILIPTDVIPDFIPLAGLLDEAVVVPLGIRLALKLIPPQVLSECRHQAVMNPLNKRLKTWLTGFIIILLVWLAILGYLFWRTFLAVIES